MESEYQGKTRQGSGILGDVQGHIGPSFLDAGAVWLHLFYVMINPILCYVTLVYDMWVPSILICEATIIY